MSIRKKIVWLPYDMDTAIGINNEGELVFGYELEDTDHLSGGAEVYNGQSSVIWNNIRLAFFNELRDMYRTLRSQGKLSYEAIERAFEEHQAKWPEALFNEDSQFCYLDPLINDGTNYLAMLQGNKAEQRKWWLYNRFRYIDSKYNAGDALSDLIQLRSYAKSNITITPYADIYPTVKFGSYLVSSRGTRNVATTLICPVDTLNDTETYIYSASQLASVGDLSGLKVGFADFSMATKLQSLKIGDGSVDYENQNLKTLYLGNNVLLQTIDVRNCTALGSGDLKVVDASGCTGLRKAWFTGTQISALTLPIGGVLDELALPATITNLTVRNQPRLATFSITGNSYSNISTCRIENTPYFTENETALTALIAGLPNNSRLRLVGLDIDWLADTDEISDFYDTLERFRGLDISGGNLDNAYIEGTIHINSARGADIAELKARYPYMNIDALHTESTLTYMGSDNVTVFATETIYDGGNGTRVNNISKANSADGHYSYTPDGWTTTPNGNREDDAITNVVADRTVYPAYIAVVRTYTVTWKNSNGTTLETDTNVPWGSTPQYNGSTPVNPTSGGGAFRGWIPDITTVTGNQIYTASYVPVYTVSFYNGSTLLQSVNVQEGGTATYTGTTPVNPDDSSLTFLGWGATSTSTSADAVLTNITANKSVYAVFESAVVVEEITDSWDTIITNIDNGTYSTKYKIGNYKPLDLGTEGTINMQIVGINADVDANDSPIPLTFIGMELLATTQRMNVSNITTGGWADTAMRTYLTDTILPLVPSNVKARINAAKKYSSMFVGSTYNVNACVTYDKLWIPNTREVGGGDNYVETLGASYANIYADNASRVKSNAYWWLRSVDNRVGATYSRQFSIVIDTGIIVSSLDGTANKYNGIALGFCLGLEPETITDDWATILANENYATDYSIGDTKMIDLGTEGKHLMEIVAFDTDDRADGQGKAGITWISKDLLNTERTMNDTAITAGGWASSGMRSYLKNTIKPLIPATVRNAIVEVSKVSSSYENDTLVTNGLITTDDVWIPSNHEIYTGGNYETTGATYVNKFSDNSKRIKKKLGLTTANNWWTRSVNSGTYYRFVSNTGNLKQASYTNTYGIVLGFCTN